MRLRSVALALPVALAAAVCVRLGVWQLGRLADKHRANAAMRAAITSAPRAVRETPPPFAELEGHRVVAQGWYDETHHVLLEARWVNDTAGVEVVTPLLLSGGSAILVDRGWVPSSDGLHARTDHFAEPGPLAVVGLAQLIPRGNAGWHWEQLGARGAELWSARSLDLDSVSVRLPYAIAPYVLRALPDSSRRPWPRRAPLAPLDEGTHLSYAIQWFAFALAILGGYGALAWRGRRRPAPAA